jgi:hypothetical protein
MESIVDKKEFKPLDKNKISATEFHFKMKFFVEDLNKQMDDFIKKWEQPGIEFFGDGKINIQYATTGTEFIRK